MRNSFKNLFIVFLVALLGGLLGGYGGNAIYNTNNIKNNDIQNNQTVNTTFSNKEESSLKEGINKAYETVVEISVDKSSTYFGQQLASTSKGSGVVISEDGYIVTNAHVIKDGDGIKVKDANGNIYAAKLIGYDTKTDLAVIKIEANNLKYVTISDSDSLEIGDTAIVIGNPLGNGISVSDGIISALNKEISIENETMYLIQTNAAVNQGNSGGGLFDINGNLIGIVNAKSGNTSSSVSVEGLGYAIPSNTVTKIANDIISNGYVKNRATLGVKISQINQDANGFPKGVYVIEVIEGGAAQEADIHVYDRIIELNGKSISTYGELSAALNELNVGDTTTIKVVRNNEELTLEITLKENVQSVE